MESPISKKLALLNQTTLGSLNLDNATDIIHNFSVAGMEILDADFAVGWQRIEDKDDEDYKLAFQSQGLPFEPKVPRSDGMRNQIEKSQTPFFASDILASIPNNLDLINFVKSLVIIPISYKSFIYGNIVFYFKDIHNFSAEEKSFCNAIGNSAAQTITINKYMREEQKARVNAQNQEARFRALIENSYDAIALLNQEGKIIDISRSILKLTGFNVNQLLGKEIFELVHPENIETVKLHLISTLSEKDGPKTIEFQYVHEDGSVRWMEAVCMNMLNNPVVNAIVVNIREATERKESQKLIEQQALHDSLTGLPNRKKFAILFEQSEKNIKRENSQMALMFLDLDRFKNINDRLGHAAGDTLLKVISSRFLSVLRNDDVVARFGGDEFLILLNKVDTVKDVSLIAEKILKAVAVPVKLGEHTIHPSISIGIAMYPLDGSNMHTLKKNADIALYESKKKGRNTYSFYDHASDSLITTEKLNFENELHDAINYEQIDVFYQSIINIKTEKIEAIEALARWNHPDKGLILPGDFLPLAEETGQIAKLNKYIFTKACEDFKSFSKILGKNFRVAINVSAVRFSEANFVKEIEGVLSLCSLNPKNLELEITETIAMGEVDITKTNLKLLKELGIKISIDDFGTGYSSLSYLKKFPIDNLKIDKSFIHSSITSSQDTAIVKTIIAMAKNLNMKVIAEGVETQQQLDLLKSLDCDMAQGFYINKPMPKKEFLKFIKNKI